MKTKKFFKKYGESISFIGICAIVIAFVRYLFDCVRHVTIWKANCIEKRIEVEEENCENNSEE